MLSPRSSRILLRPIVLATALFVLPAHGLAVTADELIELRRSGVGDEVLIALIETTGVPAPVAPDVVLRMRESGLSDRVIAAAIRAVPPPAPASPIAEPAEPAPNVAMIGYGPQDVAPEPAYVIEREVVYVPWVVPVRGRPEKAHVARPYFEGDRKFGRFINDGFVEPARPRHRARRR